MSMHLPIQLLSDTEFDAAYLPLCQTINNITPDFEREVYAELELLDDILRPALEARWGKTDAYWAVSDDWTVCWHHSMYLCSDKMCCAEFVAIVQRALAQMNHDWCFHVSIECSEDMGWGLQHAGRGEMFFYKGNVFGNSDDDFDYGLFEK